jgi:hypothetical protein
MPDACGNRRRLSSKARVEVDNAADKGEKSKKP